VLGTFDCTVSDDEFYLIQQKKGATETYTHYEGMSISKTS